MPGVLDLLIEENTRILSKRRKAGAPRADLIRWRGCGNEGESRRVSIVNATYQQTICPVHSDAPGEAVMNR